MRQKKIFFHPQTSCTNTNIHALECIIILDSVLIDWHENCMILCEKGKNLETDDSCAHDTQLYIDRCMRRSNVLNIFFFFSSFNVYHDSFKWMKVSRFIYTIALKGTNRMTLQLSYGKIRFLLTHSTATFNLILITFFHKKNKKFIDLLQFSKHS